MEADIYGMIPNAKTEALAKAPPVKAFKIPKIPLSVLEDNSANCVVSIPGRTIWAPKR